MELQQLGWNAVTVGLCGIIFFTFLGSWALWRQNQKIWASKSGESVSIAWLSYFGCFHVAIFIYGLSIKSIALIINGSVRAPLHVPILIGLYRFKGFNQKDGLLLAGLVVALTVMTMTPIKDHFFLWFTVGSLVFIAMLPIEIWRSKTTGVVEIRLPLVMISATSFWAAYGFAIDDWVIKSTSLIYFAVLGVTIALWVRYRRTNIARNRG